MLDIDVDYPSETIKLTLINEGDRETFVEVHGF